MSVNPSISLAGVALQKTRGEKKNAPDYIHGLTGGCVFKSDRSIESANVSCGVRGDISAYIESVKTGADFETYAYPDVTALYLYAAMGNIASMKQGTEERPSQYHSHAITLGNSIPFLTTFGRLGTEEFQIVRDAKVDELEISIEGNKPIQLGITLMGCKGETKKVVSTGDPSCFGGYFVPTGGSFYFSSSGGQETAAEVQVLSANFKISNNCKEFTPAGKVSATDISEGKQTVSGDITVHIDNLDDYYQIVSGSKEGGEVTGNIAYGSFAIMLHADNDPRTTMTISASRVPFNCEFPEVDPEGSGVDMKFSFDNLYLSNKIDSPLTLEVINKVEKYI